MPQVSELRVKLAELRDVWRREGVPPRHGLLEALQKLKTWREAGNLPGLWPDRPLMITATLDDGWGHGLIPIHLIAEIAGMRVLPLGLLQPPEVMIDACREQNPALLGLTVLQLDSEENLARIRREIPKATRIIAGGPVFQIDPEMAERCGVDVVARHAGDFLAFILSI